MWRWHLTIQSDDAKARPAELGVFLIWDHYTHDNQANSEINTWNSSSFGLLGKPYGMTLALIVGACTDLLAKQRGMINHHRDQPKITKILGLLFQLVYCFNYCDIWWLMFLHTRTTKDFYLIMIPIFHVFMRIIVFVYAYVHMCMYVCVCMVYMWVYVVWCVCVCACVRVYVCVCMSVHICVECLLAWYIIPYMAERCITANHHCIKYMNGPLCVNHKPNHKLLTITRIKLYRSFHLLNLTS